MVCDIMECYMPYLITKRKWSIRKLGLSQRDPNPKSSTCVTVIIVKHPSTKSSLSVCMIIDYYWLQSNSKR